MEKIEFVCSLADISSPIKSIKQGGMRITIDIPETHVGNAIRIWNMRQKCLKAVLEVTE